MDLCVPPPQSCLERFLALKCKHADACISRKPTTDNDSPSWPWTLSNSCSFTFAGTQSETINEKWIWKSCGEPIQREIWEINRLSNPKLDMTLGWWWNSYIYIYRHTPRFTSCCSFTSQMWQRLLRMCSVVPTGVKVTAAAIQSKGYHLPTTAESTAFRALNLKKSLPCILPLKANGEFSNATTSG